MINILSILLILQIYPMFIMTLFHGIAIAIAVEAPIGPIALLTINRTLTRGWRAGMMTGLASATALSIFCILAGTGLTTIMNAIDQHQTTFRLFGSSIVLILGIRTLFSARHQSEQNTQLESSHTKDYSSAFSLAISNPGTMLLFIGAYATISTTAQLDHANSIIALTLGVFLGSTGWWLGLSLIIQKIRHKLPESAKQMLSIIAGIIMIVIGLSAFFSTFLF